MQIFLVGGAVRDKLLGLEVKDNDWVVVGATPEQMEDLGYHPVGKDFPVFLHPETKEEYALARTERKNGHGYGGFTFYASVDITIEEDLLRRDLTINSMAEDELGNIIDPYGGQKDLKNRIIRHVSSAFIEDPLRILRVARFAAMLAPLGFQVAEETIRLMNAMVGSKELSYLTQERIWQETANALMLASPWIYFQVLETCGAFKELFPELSSCLDHPENQALKYLQSASQTNNNPLVRFGCLFIPVLTQSEAEIIKDVVKIETALSRMKLPSEFADIALLVIKNAHKVHAVVQNPEPKTLLSLFETVDAIRRPKRFDTLLTILSYSFERVKLQKVQVMSLLNDCLEIKISSSISLGYKGKEIGQLLRKKRLQVIALQMHSDKQKP